MKADSWLIQSDVVAILSFIWAGGPNKVYVAQCQMYISPLCREQWCIHLTEQSILWKYKKSREKSVYFIYTEMMQCASWRGWMWDKNTWVHFNFQVAPAARYYSGSCTCFRKTVPLDFVFYKAIWFIIIIMLQFIIAYLRSVTRDHNDSIHLLSISTLSNAGS